MKILMVNKYLFPKGGAETYVLELGRYLSQKGHEVQYFGMDHPDRCVGNHLNLYTREMDFHEAGVMTKLGYLRDIVYSKEAKEKMEAVLADMEPDIVHLNNIHFQLTPSIMKAVEAYRKKSGRQVKLIVTAHDYQLICPNHMLYRPNEQKVCELCVDGQYMNCTKGRCIHGSTARSVMGSIESIYWHRSGIYESIDRIICPSLFLKRKLDQNAVFADKTIAIHNFAGESQSQSADAIEKKDYVLYFGRYSEEKGLDTLIEACKRLPDIQFIFAGGGPMEGKLEGIPNLKNVGFQTGAALKQLISEAVFSVYPSEWYENCPFSLIESQMYGTPVLAANMGGIPELIDEDRTGRLFDAGNVQALTENIADLWHNRDWLRESSRRCLAKEFMSIEAYYEKMMAIYTGE